MQEIRVFLTTGSWIYMCPNFLSADETRAIEQLADAAKPESIHLYGKTYASPRRVRNFGALRHAYGGETRIPEPLPDCLRAIQERAWMHLSALGWTDLVENPCDLFVLNVYDSGKDCIGHHSDTKTSGVFVDSNGCSLIGSVSVGAPARMEFKNKTTGEMRSVMILPGMLLVMGGTTQQTHTHAIPRDAKRIGRRINATWRTVALSNKRARNS